MNERLARALDEWYIAHGDFYDGGPRLREQSVRLHRAEEDLVIAWHPYREQRRKS